MAAAGSKYQLTCGSQIKCFCVCRAQWEDDNVTADDTPRKHALETQAGAPQAPLQEAQGHFTLALAWVLQELLRGPCSWVGGQVGTSGSPGTDWPNQDQDVMGNQQRSISLADSASRSGSVICVSHLHTGSLGLRVPVGFMVTSHVQTLSRVLGPSPTSDPVSHTSV